MLLAESSKIHGVCWPVESFSTEWFQIGRLIYARRRPAAAPCDPFLLKMQNTRFKILFRKYTERSEFCEGFASAIVLGFIYLPTYLPTSFLESLLPY